MVVWVVYMIDQGYVYKTHKCFSLFLRYVLYSCNVLHATPYNYLHVFIYTCMSHDFNINVLMITRSHCTSECVRFVIEF